MHMLMLLLLCGSAIACAPPTSTAPPKVPIPVTTTPVEYSRSGFDVRPLARDVVAQLAKKLTPEQYRVTQDSGTEQAFCGTLLDNKKTGDYCCIVCGLPLFSSAHKFDSGSGWPSFFQPFDKAHVAEIEDDTLGMRRVEINCARCNAHLGHVFDDGPRPTGLRFCLNGAALKFYEKGEVRPSESMPITFETAYFAGGCFWGVEHYFQLAPGVISATSGYMGGSSAAPTYDEICQQDNVPAASRPASYIPHAEAVKVVFDPTRISYARLLEGFFQMHDPTQLNMQGPDTGTQYRSGIYTTSDAQQTAALLAITNYNVLALTKSKSKAVTEVQTAKAFTAAEEYHQDYERSHPENPYVQNVSIPRLERMKTQFPELLKGKH